MKKEEKLAQSYLTTLFPESLEFEPDGKIPPDFLLNNSVAVEVTRLNEHIKVSDMLKKVDDDNHSIISSINKTIKNYESTINDACFYVNIYIKRPFGKKKKAKKKLINFLNNFCTSDDVILYKKYEITDKLSLSFIKGTYKECTPTFQLGEIIEYEIGEFIFKDISTNINFCIENKSSKIEPYKSQYQEWWLVLIDTIAEGCYTEYIKDFEKVIDKGNFDKVIVLEPSNGNYIFEI